MHTRGTSKVLSFFLRLLTDRTSQCRIEILCNLSASEPVDHRASPSLVLATTAFSSRSMMPVAGSLESFFCFLLQITLCRLIFRSPFFSLKFAVPAASASFPLVLALYPLVCFDVCLYYVAAGSPRLHHAFSTFISCALRSFLSKFAFKVVAFIF